jgi:hypothetical protein
MLSNRISLGLAAFLLVVSASVRAQGQDHELAGAALFEPADVRPYDNWAQPKQGLFVTFDGLYWHISPPAKTSVGDPTLTPTVFVGPSLADSFIEQNSIDTGVKSSVWKWGDRMELGYVDDHQGFMFTSLSTESQTSETSVTNAFVVFNDPAFGPAGSHYLDTVLSGSTATTPAVIGETPVMFQHLYVQNKSRVAGVEALYLYRASELPLGADLEFTAGGRYFELKDQFWVDARGGNLTDSFWNTSSHNEISGPEIGVRWYQPIGRFGISAESRFTAGINAQSVNQDGLLAKSLLAGQNNTLTIADGATAYPTLMNATSFTHSTHWIEFSPIVELRVEAHAQLTNLIAVKAGYTGIFVNNVVRAADMVDYTVPTMGITRSLNGNLQQVYMQGLNLSIEFNR